MKKAITLLFLTAVVLGLAACSRAEAHEDAPTQTAAYTPNTPDIPPTDHDPAPTAILAGVVQSIDGVRIAVDTSSLFVADGSGPHHFSGEPQDPPEPRDEIIRLTEHTVIEIRTTAGGQIIDTVAGTMEDVTLHAVVIAEGAWQDDEFVAATLTVANF